MWKHLKRRLTSANSIPFWIIAITCTVFLCFGPIQGWPATYWETEINDYISAADSFTSDNSTIKANAFNGDWDFFSFSASSGDIIYFQILRESTDGSTLRYEIRDTSNNTLWRSILVGYDTNTGNQTFGVGSSGMYYLAIKGSKYTMYNATVWNSTQ